MINIRKIIIVFSTIILIISVFLFANTEGLMDSYGNYVYEYQSSGSNDDICIGISIFIFLPFLFFMFTLKKRIFVIEFILGNILIIFQIILLLLIDVGSILHTIIYGNIPLLIWLISFFALFIELNGFFIYECGR